MPLSEHEQRQLEQIEQALYADHPRLAKRMRAKDPKVHYRRRVILAAIGFLIGVGGVVAGFLLKYSWLEAAGFAVMLACSAWAVSSYRRMSGIVLERRRGLDGTGTDRGGRSRPGKERRPRPAPSSGLMERIEERWRRRQEGNSR
ncbi:MAG: DUF3040 domain-containing protein [Streptosporangiaceae bacterium]